MSEPLTDASLRLGPEGFVFEGLDDISPEAAVGFGRRRHRKIIISFEIS